MNILKTLNWKKYTIVSLSILVGLLLVGYLFILGYSYFYEQDKIAVDRYNFEQLEKAKPVLEKMSQQDKKIFTVKTFNDLYRANIQPIKNCYYISNSNGDYPYIFGFKFESLMYKVLYFGENYAYPKYDIPVNYFCGGSMGCHDDMTLWGFIGTISDSCGGYWDEQHN